MASWSDWTRVRITVPGQFYGLEGTVTMVYYDHKHTGDSPDRIYFKLDDGRELSTLRPNLEPVEAGVSLGQQ